MRSIEHGNLLDDSSLELFKAHDAFLVPNVGVYRVLKLEGRDHGQSAESAAKVDAVLNGGLASLERAHAYGVNIAFGSDLLGPMHKYQNEEFLVRAEVQPVLAILRSATVVGARLLGREGHIGELSPGADADMVLLDANPLDDVGVLGDPVKYVRAVVQRGTVVVQNGRIQA